MVRLAELKSPKSNFLEILNIKNRLSRKVIGELSTYVIFIFLAKSVLRQKIRRTGGFFTYSNFLPVYIRRLIFAVVDFFLLSSYFWLHYILVNFLINLVWTKSWYMVELSFFRFLIFFITKIFFLLIFFCFFFHFIIISIDHFQYGVQWNFLFTNSKFFIVLIKFISM